MKICRIKRAAFTFCALVATLTMTAAWSQGYPHKPVRLIVPFAPGGGTDLLGRAIAVRLSEALAQPVVVDNRVGAGGVIGAEIVAKAPSDGYTLLLGSPGPLTINPNLLAKMPYALKDFAPITLATISPFILVVNPSVPVHSVKELIELAKAKPNTLNFGSAGNGSVAHLAAEQFKALASVQLVHVPYKGSSPAMVDLLAGRLQMEFENLPIVWPHIKSGKLRALAAGTKKRSALVPDLATMIEAGVPGYEASTAFGILAPAGTPRDVVSQLNTEIVRILRVSDAKDRLLDLGLEIVGSTPEQYAQHLREESSQHARIAKAAHVTLD